MISLPQITEKREALEVCDTIIQQVRINFYFTGHLMAADLFEAKEFSCYRKHFPHIVVNMYAFLKRK